MSVTTVSPLQYLSQTGTTAHYSIDLYLSVTQEYHTVKVSAKDGIFPTLGLGDKEAAITSYLQHALSRLRKELCDRGYVYKVKSLESVEFDVTPQYVGITLVLDYSKPHKKMTGKFHFRGYELLSSNTLPPTFHTQLTTGIEAFLELQGNASIRTLSPVQARELNDLYNMSIREQSVVMAEVACDGVPRYFLYLTKNQLKNQQCLEMEEELYRRYQ